jgi:Beta-lactamase enzyme family
LSAADGLAAQQMMEDRDNDAATTLWFSTGGPASIGSFNAKAGLRSTSLSGYVDRPGFPWPGRGLSTTTPQDQIVLLRQLLPSRSLLNPGEGDYVLGLMEHVTPAQRWGISTSVPTTVAVALKDGWLPLTSADDDWQINSVGWISGEGRDYMMAVLTTGNATEQYGITTIDEFAAMVWRDMR